MSLFDRKTFLDGSGFKSVNNISLGINDIVNVGTMGLVPDITGEDAAAAALAAGEAANQKAQDRLDAQFETTRADLMPFLQAGTGALPDYQAGINQAPSAPTLDKFQFDVNNALNSPELAFQRQFGEQQMDRIAGKNKQLGSGNRLYDVTRFGQGLAAQSLGDQYNRDFNTFSANQNTDLKNYSLADQRYNNRMNRLAGLIDVGRGMGSAMGSFGAQNASNVAGLLQNTGALQGAEAMAGYNGINNLLNMGASTVGAIYGGAPGAAVGGNLFPTSSASVPGYSPIGSQDAQGVF